MIQNKGNRNQTITINLKKIIKRNNQNRDQDPDRNPLLHYTEKLDFEDDNNNN